MAFRDKMDKYFRDSYFQKYGDRITSASGTIVSVKTQEKNYFIAHKLICEMVIKPEVGKAVIKAKYSKFKWFKKIEFIALKIGHKVMIMGLKGVKGKKDSDIIQVQNIINLTTKKDLVPIDHSQIKKSRQQAGRMRY